MKSKVFKNILAVSALCLIPCQALSQPENKSHFPPFFISQSGGAGLKEDLSYIINPALLGFHRKSKVALSYSLQNKRQTGMISVLDLKTSLPIAVSYQRTWLDSFNTPQISYWFFNSGFRLSPFSSIGASVKKDLLSSAWNFNLGSLLKVSSNFAFGLYADNLLKESNKNLKSLSLAGFYEWKKFFLTHVDLSRSQKEWIVKGAFQSLFHPFFSVKLGAFATLSEMNWNTVKRQVLSGGLSFNSPKFILEYGIQKEKLSYQHSLSFLLKI